MGDFSEIRSYSLTRLVSLVIAGNYSYTDIRDTIEEKVYLPESGDTHESVSEQMGRLAKELEVNTDTNPEEMYEIFLITGEAYQISGDYPRSVEWLKKAAEMGENPECAWHSLGVSCMKLCRSTEAAQAFMKEIEIAPGNYYTYFLAADMWIKAGHTERAAEVIADLLERDPNNIRALHWIIKYYDSRSTDTSILRNRILNIDRKFISRDYIIWTYYMKSESRTDEAIAFLSSMYQESPEISVIKLLLLYLFICKGNYPGMKDSLREFKRLNQGRAKSIKIKLEEFESVFGSYECSKIESRLQTAGIAGI